MQNKKFQIYNKFSTLTIITILSILLLVTTQEVSAFHQHKSPVQLFSDLSVVSGASSSLTTTDKQATFNLHTSQLMPNHAYTIWWVIFNHPEMCSHGPTESIRCGEGDLDVPAVNASVLYGDGKVINYKGTGNFNGKLKVDDTTGSLLGPGLINPQGADIHFIVHDHGRIIKGLTREMTHTFGAGCNNAPEGTGTPGPNECVDVQFSVHEQQN